MCETMNGAHQFAIITLEMNVGVELSTEFTSKVYVYVHTTKL